VQHREPEPWETSAPGAFLSMQGAREVAVCALGADRFRVESPDGPQLVDGFDRAQELAHKLASN
jgi:hypothetical protein